MNSLYNESEVILERPATQGTQQTSMTMSEEWKEPNGVSEGIHRHNQLDLGGTTYENGIEHRLLRIIDERKEMDGSSTLDHIPFLLKRSQQVTPAGKHPLKRSHQVTPVGSSTLMLLFQALMDENAGDGSKRANSKVLHRLKRSQQVTPV